MPSSLFAKTVENVPDELRAEIKSLIAIAVTLDQDPTTLLDGMLDDGLQENPLQDHLLNIRRYLVPNLLQDRTSAPTSPEQRSTEPYLFRMMALVLPRRLWEEELGDALEVLHALRECGAPRWQIRLKIFSTFAWGLVNALREVMSAMTGQAREREK